MTHDPGYLLAAGVSLGASAGLAVSEWRLRRIDRDLREHLRRGAGRTGRPAERPRRGQ